MPFDSGFPTGEDIKPLLYAHDPEQIYDLIFYPLPRQILRWLQQSMYPFNFPRDNPVRRWINFPLHFSRQGWNFFEVEQDISFLFQRFNRFGCNFADQYSTKLFNFFNKFAPFQPYHFLSPYPGFSAFNQPSVSVLQQFSFANLQYQSLPFEEIKIKLPENNLLIEISYYRPEYKTDLYGEIEPKEYNYGSGLFYEEWNVTTNRLDYPCFKSPISRTFNTELISDFCKGQEIILKNDILIHSLVLTFKDDLKKDIKWTNEDKEKVIDQIPEYYFYSGLDSYFDNLIDWLKTSPAINFNFIPEILLGCEAECTRSYGIFPYAVSLGNNSFGVGFSLDSAESFTNYTSNQPKTIYPTEYLNYAFVYANNNKWANYNFDIPKDQINNIVLNWAYLSPVWINHPYYPPPYLPGTNSNAKIFALIRIPVTANPPIKELNTTFTIPFAGQSVDLVFKNGVVQLNNFSHTSGNPYAGLLGGHLRSANSGDINAAQNKTSARYYPEIFLNESGHLRVIGAIGRGSISVVNSNSSNGGQAETKYYLSGHLSIYQLEADLNHKTGNLSNVKFKHLSSKSETHQISGTTFTTRQQVENLPKVISSTEEITFYKHWDYDLKSKDNILFPNKAQYEQDLLNSIEECYSCMPCNCDEINEKLDKLIAALDANKFAFLDNSTNQSRVANIGYYVERIARVLGVSVNSDGSIRSIRQSKEIIEGKEIPAGWTIGQWSRNNGGNSEGQTGGSGEEERDGLAYEIRSNTFDIDPGTGEATKIIQGGYALVENFPQLLHIILEDLDRAIGWQDAGANAIPSADGSKIATYQGLNRMLIDVLYNQSAISRSTTGAQISALKNQAILQEILASFGFPIVVKEIPVQVAEGYEAKLPVPATQGGAPTLNDLFQLILLNLSLLIGSKLKASEEAIDEEGNVNLDEE